VAYGFVIGCCLCENAWRCRMNLACSGGCVMPSIFARDVAATQQLSAVLYPPRPRPLLPRGEYWVVAADLTAALFTSGRSTKPRSKLSSTSNCVFREDIQSKRSSMFRGILSKGTRVVFSVPPRNASATTSALDQVENRSGSSSLGRLGWSEMSW
jgi:hypothetical protein